MQQLKNTIRVCFFYATALFLAAGYPLSVSAQTAEPIAVTEESTYSQSTPDIDKEADISEESPVNQSPSTADDLSGSAGEEPVIQTPTVASEESNDQFSEAEQPVGASGETQSDNSKTSIDQTINNAIENNIEANALTGDATVKNNTKAGDATTGDATTVATVINNIGSSLGLNNHTSDIATFTSDIEGDLSGDIMIYPTLLQAMLNAATQPAANTTATVTTTNEIKNNIDLSAQAGAATVSGNTIAGSATSGTANTVANIMNVINSVIAANKSFVGTINIHGNLDGDILIAPDFIPQLLASNQNISNTQQSSVDLTASNTQEIINNVNLSATSGDAGVRNNTTGGNASTGSAQTNAVILNMTGQQFVAKNSLLVFVNVLGQWVGIIVDAPSGATAAALGNDVTTNERLSQDISVDSETTTRITNNVSLTSQSGNATVSENTKAGNATSGDATASVNIANISSSQIGVSDWFGVLFINVFGSWLGSFGVDTERGSTAAVSPSSTNTKPLKHNESPSVPALSEAVQFIERAGVPSKTLSSTSPLNISHDDYQNSAHKDATKATGGNTLGVASLAVSDTVKPQGQDETRQTSLNLLPYIAGVIIIGAAAFGGKSLRDVIRRNG